MDLVKRVLGYHKSPPVLVDSCIYELDFIMRDEIPHNGRRLNKRFWQMKNFLFGKGDSDPELVECELLSKEIVEKRLILLVLLTFSKLTLEERNSFIQVFCTLLSRNHYNIATKYMVSQEGIDILSCIVRGYSRNEMTVHYGLMLRECIKIRCIHESLLSQHLLLSLLFTNYAFNSHFDICSDVLQIIHDLLRRNKQMVVIMLNPSQHLYCDVFAWMDQLILSTNYIVVRMSLQCLAEFLIDKINFDIMLYYVNDVSNLRIMMNLLCSPYPSIQYEAFNIFKIFVANPNKSPSIRKTLFINREQLLLFFVSFLSDKEEESFIEEKKLIVSIIERGSKP